jgi:peroxiredoxin
MEKTGTPIGSYAPDFELPGIDGSVHHLARYLERYRAVGVIIMCNHCPYVKMYVERLKQIQAEFQSQKFTLVGINANDDSHYPEDSFEQMKVFAATHQLNFPYLRDITQDVARSFGAERTPEAFLIDQKGVLRYGGLIDNYAQASDGVTVQYFRDAIANLLANKAISTSFTHAIGCSVKWRS